MLAEHDFKEVFGTLAAGVSVITFEVNGHLHGFTATSLTAVSLDPPLALFCVKRSSTSHEHLREGTQVGISILSADQRAVSARFATKVAIGGYVDMEVDEAFGQQRAPVLRGAVAVMAGRIKTSLALGDHTVFICELQWAQSAPQRAPLLYCSRDYHTLAPLA
jgi:flavin reductase (DIM6/NTAB) family NADH-FMN oxidoreductase RutF